MVGFAQIVVLRVALFAAVEEALSAFGSPGLTESSQIICRPDGGLLDLRESLWLVGDGPRQWTDNGWDGITEVLELHTVSMKAKEEYQSATAAPVLGVCRDAPAQLHIERRPSPAGRRRPCWSVGSAPS